MIVKFEVHIAAKVLAYESTICMNERKIKHCRFVISRKKFITYRTSEDLKNLQMEIIEDGSQSKDGNSFCYCLIVMGNRMNECRLLER